MRSLMLFWSHHADISLMVTSQNLHMSNSSTTHLRNFSDFVVFQNRGDKTTLSVLSRQIFPYKENVLTRIHDWIADNLMTERSKYIVIGRIIGTLYMNNKMKLILYFQTATISPISQQAVRCELRSFQIVRESWRQSTL